MEVVAQEAGVSKPPRVSSVVLVGQKISPAMVHSKSDGTQVRTLWGEFAWQLGKKDGYAMVKDADAGDVASGDLAESTSGVPDNIVRIVTENCRILKFDAAEFE
jgi:hypothetical protein